MELIEFNQISKSYKVDRDSDQPYVIACKDISFKIKKNTIHALIGENGAGKSTLMKILAGVETADSGFITIRQQKYEPQSAADAYKFKIGIVHQHFMLAQNLTILDHLILNWPNQSLLKKKSKSEIKSGIAQIEKKFNWQFDLSQQIKNLSVGQQQRLEILKALLVQPEIIIFDEPTAVLSPQEVTDFLKFITDLKAQGQTIILITHKLREVKIIADSVTILRRGKFVRSDSVLNLSVDEMAELMIGEKPNDFIKIKKIFDEKKMYSFLDLPFYIHQGEIFGVAGIDGNGQSELIQKVIINLKNKQIKYADISEDRYAFCLFPGLTLLQHMLLSHVQFFSKWGFVQIQKAKLQTQKLLNQWDIRPPEVYMNIENLSGGNQQKFIVARELFKNPDFILAAYPTRGVDLLAQQKIHSAFVEQATEKNKAILLISSDLDEILKLSDRYIILSQGQINGPYLQNELNESEIGLRMAGLKNV